MDQLDQSFKEHLHEVWFEHGNFFGSRVREELDGDPEAMRKVEKFEKAWRDLYEYVGNEDDRKQVKKDLIKPVIRRVIKKLK